MASQYEIRKFATGATRDQDVTKPDYEGFLSPLVIEAYGRYMNKNRVQPNGQVRASDNWQLGIPQDAYMKSMWRHFLDVWKQHRGYKSTEDLKESLCAMLFNVSGYLHELRCAELGLRPDVQQLVRNSVSRPDDSLQYNLRFNEADGGAQDLTLQDFIELTESPKQPYTSSYRFRQRAVYPGEGLGCVRGDSEAPEVSQSGVSVAGSDNS